MNQDFAGWTKVSSEGVLSDVGAVVLDGSAEVQANEPESQEAAMEYSETSEEDSEESSSSEDESNDDSKPASSREETPQILTSGYFVNEKSSVIHCLRSEDVFRCGRKRTIYYAHIRELNRMRCSRCFNL